MKYKIPLKNIKKIANPFEQAFNDQKIVSLEETNRILVEGETGLDPTSPRTHYIKQLTEKIALYGQEQNEEIVLDFSDVSNNEKGWFVTSGLLELANAIYYEKEYVVADIIGTEKTIKLLLGKSVPLTEEEAKTLTNIKTKKTVNNNDNAQIDWEYLKTALNVNTENKVLDEETMTESLKSLYRNSSNITFADISKIIPEEKWEDPTFLNNFFLSYSVISSHFHPLVHLPDEIILSDVFLSELLKLKNGLEEEKEMFIWFFDKFWTARLEFLYEEASTNPNEKNIKIKELIDTQIFTTDFFIEASSTREFVKFLAFTQEKDFSNKTLENNIKERIKEQSLEIGFVIDILPKNYFTDVETTFNLLNCVAWRIRYSEDPRVRMIKNRPHIIESWSHDTEQVKQLISHIEYNHANIFLLLPEAIKNNRTIVELMMVKDYNIYEMLSEPLKEDTELFLKYIVETDCAENHIEKIKKLTDKETLKKIITNNPTLMVNKKMLLEHRQDEELLVCIGDKFTELKDKISDVAIKNLCKNTKLLESFIEETPNNYTTLPLFAKLNKNCAISFLSYEYDENEIPAILWKDKEFCLKAIEISYSHIEKVPREYLCEKSFVLSILKMVDEGEISSVILDKVLEPIENIIENIEVGEYEEYFKRCFMQEQLEKGLVEKNTTIVRKKKL